MSKHAWSNNHLAIIGAQLSKLPDTPVNHWTEMKAVKDRLQEIMTEANLALAAIEDDAGLTPQGRQQRAAEMDKSVNAKIDVAIESATKAAARRIAALETKLAGAIEKPADPAVAAEIRKYVATSKSPILTAMAQKHDPVIVSALVHAPSILSGLTPGDIETIKANVLGARAEQQEIGAIRNALQVVEAAKKSAASMLSQRVGIRAAPTLRPVSAESAKVA